MGVDPFNHNQHGIWCPNCQERVDDAWPVSCDFCGYPAKDHETFDHDPDYDFDCDGDYDAVPPTGASDGRA